MRWPEIKDIVGLYIVAWPFLLNTDLLTREAEVGIILKRK